MWLSGQKIQRGAHEYLLRPPLETVVSPDRSYLWRQGCASRLGSDRRPVWLREILVFTDTAAASAHTVALRRESTLLSELADVAKVPRLLETLNGDDRVTVIHTTWPVRTLVAVAQVRRHGYPHNWLLDLLVRTAEVLGHPHERSISHRLVDPSGILVVGAGAALRDLGLAALPASAGEAPDAYQAPEQRDYPELVGPRTDVYRLAATAYETLTGRVPTDSAVPPSTVNPELNPNLDGVVLRALGPYRDRPANGAEFAAELTAARQR